MPLVDQFESLFKSAAKTVYHYRRPDLRKLLIVTDLDATGTEALSGRLRQFLDVLDDEAEWTAVTGDECRTVEQLLGLVQRHQPGLVCTYRNLHSTAWQWPHSLGRHLDVLTQATECPILVIPHPHANRQLDHALENTDVVMAMTDHLAGDERLVNYAVRMTDSQGMLFLTHVEDQAILDRYIDTIGKIPSIDTDNARQEIQRQLLKEPQEYIELCAKTLQSANVSIKVVPIVTMGHHLREYRRMIEEHAVDLLVINTKEGDQLAMHGLAYPLAIELRQIPLLML